MNDGCATASSLFSLQDPPDTPEIDISDDEFSIMGTKKRRIVSYSEDEDEDKGSEQLKESDESQNLGMYDETGRWGVVCVVVYL